MIMLVMLRIDCSPAARCVGTTAATERAPSEGPQSGRTVGSLALLGARYLSTRASTTPMMRKLGIVCTMIPIQVLWNRRLG